ncbi:MAG: hypothetical protein EP344_15580 [Bacteroidetes bacterium]|nr:MAG: hypothetical protein EP344_15580 [Bacteroidota bacterium]
MKLKLPVFPLFFVLPFCALHAQSSALEVYKIFEAKCISCHDHASPEAGLDLEGVGATASARAIGVAANLLGATPTNAHAQVQGYKRVVAGRPDKSLLFRKINNGFESFIPPLHANEGGTMPAYPAPGGGLTDLEKEIIRQWILFGGKPVGTQFDKSVLEEFYSGNGEKSFPDGPPPAPAPADGFQIKMGPFYLEADGEVEYFHKYALNLPENVEVHRMEILISPYSHHFLAYNFNSQSSADQIPDGLRLNSYHNNINLVAAVQEQTDLKLPAGTAFRWDKNIILDLNSHYINYLLTRPYQCEAYVNIYTRPVGTAQQEMKAALLVNYNIPIPNNGNLITHTKSEFQFGADSIYFWGLMGHTHKYGTGYKVWKRLPNGQKGELIYDASCPLGVPGCPAPYFDYQHIPLRYWEPQLLPVLWNDGLIHEANWVNEGPQPLNFGPTSDDEMMVLIAFYTEQQVTVDAPEPVVPVDLNRLTVYPNPATGEVWIQPSGQAGIRMLRVFDLAGREQLRRIQLPAGPVRLDLAGFAPGMYWIDADGQQAKLIVKM